MEIARLEATGGDKGVIAEKRALMEQIDAMAEANPMLGLRGCRLGIVYPILPVMQVRAIATAAAKLKKEGLDPKPEIMIPLVSVVPELAKLREVAEQTSRPSSSRSTSRSACCPTTRSPRLTPALPSW